MGITSRLSNFTLASIIDTVAKRLEAVSFFPVHEKSDEREGKVVDSGQTVTSGCNGQASRRCTRNTRCAIARIRVCASARFIASIGSVEYKAQRIVGLCYSELRQRECERYS